MGFIADRVELIESAHDDIRHYASQFQSHVLAQTKVLRETSRHLEDVDYRGRRNNIRVSGIFKTEGREDLQLILENILHRLLGEPLS